MRKASSEVQEMGRQGGIWKAWLEQGQGAWPEDLSHPLFNQTIALPRPQHCVTITIRQHHPMPFETLLDA